VARANSQRLTLPTLGELCHRVTIQRMVDSQGADGSSVETAVTFATVWASMSPRAGSEYYAAQGISASMVYEFWMHYMPGITPKMQIAFEDRTFNIESVRDYDARHQWLIGLATEVV
jgi:SPP1 family predicted phage head-tail adaptor